MSYSRAVSALLIVAAVLLSAKNGLSLLRDRVAFGEMLAHLHVTNAVMKGLIGATLVSALLLLLPETIFIGCVVQIACFACVAALQLRTGNVRGALIEAPFIAMMVALAYLGHPLAK